MAVTLLNHPDPMIDIAAVKVRFADAPYLPPVMELAMWRTTLGAPKKE